MAKSKEEFEKEINKLKEEMYAAHPGCLDRAGRWVSDHKYLVGAVLAAAAAGGGYVYHTREATAEE